MRITNNMMAYNYLKSLNTSMERQNKLQEQLSDGKSIHRPSDDPIKVIRSLRFNTSLDMNDQYTQNMTDALSWMESTDGAMKDISSVMARAKELTISADGTKPPEAMQAIGAEIDQLINQLVTVGNQKVGDRYLFAGQMDKTEPFTRKQIVDPVTNQVMDTVVYNGDLNKISMSVRPGAVQPFTDSVNLNGSDVFGPLQYVNGMPTLGAFNQLIQLKNELMKPAQVTRSNQNGGAGVVQGTYNGTGTAQTGNFTIKVTGVDANGQVSGADYSTDGGTTWTTATFNAASPSVIPLTNGVSLSIAATPPPAAGGNAVNDRYTFKTTNPVTQTNAAGGVGTVGGNYTGIGYTNFQVKVGTVDAAGQVTAATYSVDGGTTWVPATSLTAGNPSQITLTNGVTFAIAATTNTLGGDVYKFKVPLPDESKADVAWISNIGVANVDSIHNTIIQNYTQLGARMSTYEMAKSMMEEASTTIAGDVAANEDLDIPAAIIDFKTSENVYKNALAVGARIMPPSLVDFLR